MNSFVSILVVLVAVGFTIFHSQPSPPQSPLLYQWQTIDGHTIKYQNYEIFYKDVKGVANNTEDLLVLHGFPTSSFDFYLMLPGLKKAFNRVILLDFLGFGYSDKPRFHDYSIFEQANITEFLLKSLKVNNVHVLSHDYGDTVAQELLARQILDRERPFHIKSLMLLNGGIFPSVHRMTWSQYFLRVPVISAVFSRLMNSYSFRIGLSHVFGEFSKPSLADVTHYWYLSRLKDGYRVFAGILNYIDERNEHETRWVNALQRPKIPVCMIYGPSDPVNPSSTFVEHYKKFIPNPCIHVLPQIGHYPQLEAPPETLTLYVSFLKDVLNLEISEEHARVSMPESLHSHDDDEDVHKLMMSHELPLEMAEKMGATPKQGL